jgi:hypothetical protein
MTYYTTTETQEIYGTVCFAYPDKNGVETENSLNEYAAKSQGLIELRFVKSIKDI